MGYGLHNCMTHQNKACVHCNSWQLILNWVSTVSMNQDQCQTDHVSISSHSLSVSQGRHKLLAQYSDIFAASMDWVPSQLPCLSSMALSCCKIIFLSCRIPDFNNEIGECLSLTIPAALTVLAICDRSKDGRARDGRRYNHNITAVVTNSTQQHLITIILTSNDGTHCLSMLLMMTGNS